MGESEAKRLWIHQGKEDMDQRDIFQCAVFQEGQEMGQVSCSQLEDSDKAG